MIHRIIAVNQIHFKILANYAGLVANALSGNAMEALAQALQITVGMVQFLAKIDVTPRSA